MKIHSLSGCACHNTIRSLPSNQLDVAYSILKFDGHTYECEHHPTQPREDVQTKDPAKVCCVVCQGQRYVAIRGFLVLCGCFNGQMIRRPAPRKSLERHDQNRFWRKWRHDRNDLRMDALIKYHRRRGNVALANALTQRYFPERVRWDAGTMEPLP